MTQLDYLNNTYLFESSATFLETREHEKGLAVILDATIFYPQGGGQPADHGKIVSQNGAFIVRDVRLDEEGIVWHFGNFENGSFTAGEKVTLTLDEERRTLNARLHSAGHLLDCAVTNLHLENLKPTKGYHFPDGPYVEYDGAVENPQELISKLQQEIDVLVEKDILVECKELSHEEACAKGIHAPAGKSARTIGFSGFDPCGCGGTHVEHASQIGKITIRKIKSKQGITKISYEL